MRQLLKRLRSGVLTQPADRPSLHLSCAALSFPYTSRKASTSAVSPDVSTSTTAGFVSSAKASTYWTSSLFQAFWISLFLLSPGQSKLCHYTVVCYFLWAPLTAEAFPTHSPVISISHTYCCSVMAALINIIINFTYVCAGWRFLRPAPVLLVCLSPGVIHTFFPNL